MNQNIEKRFSMVKGSKTFRNIVNQFDLSNKAVLDLGCSYGEFLVNFGKGSTGITITREEVEYGVENGLDIRFGNIESDDFILEEKYDVIFANNIFEHLYSPHYFLIKIRKYLKPDGILILGVPCIPKLVSLVKLPKFRGSLASAHINFFTRETLKKTTQRGGWLISAIRGFHFNNRFIDSLLNLIYPHFYVIAKPDQSFSYNEKRMKELVGYTDLFGENIVNKSNKVSL